MKYYIASVLVYLSQIAHADVSLDTAAEEIVKAGVFLNQSHLCPATSGNISMRLNPETIAITASGKHKGELTTADILTVDLDGKPLENSKKPSAETLLHTLIYRTFDDAGAVLHTHSANGTVLSRLAGTESSIVTKGYEIHKALKGITTHESEVVIPIFENNRNISALSQEISNYLASNPKTHGFLLRGHGFYTWGKDMQEAKIRTETFEYLFECELKTKKRTLSKASIQENSVAAILTDIEGTTTSISFVHDVLFPYAKDNMHSYVTEHEGELTSIIDEVKSIAGTSDADLEQVIATLISWIEQDKKYTPLKTLQGLMWVDGYEKGAFVGHVYDDAFLNIKKWHELGLPIYIYSSGSVFAQKLLFGHTAYGDLNPLFSGNFDTKVGNKRETASYIAITQQMGIPANRILFLSDAKEELDAAMEAGMQTLFLNRDHLKINPVPHPSVTSFDEIQGINAVN